MSLGAFSSTNQAHACNTQAGVLIVPLTRYWATGITQEPTLSLTTKLTVTTKVRKLLLYGRPINCCSLSVTKKSRRSGGSIFNVSSFRSRIVGTLGEFRYLSAQNQAKTQWEQLARPHLVSELILSHPSDRG